MTVTVVKQGGNALWTAEPVDLVALLLDNNWRKGRLRERDELARLARGPFSVCIMQNGVVLGLGGNMERAIDEVVRLAAVVPPTHIQPELPL